MIAEVHSIADLKYSKQQILKYNKQELDPKIKMQQITKY